MYVPLKSEIEPMRTLCCVSIQWGEKQVIAFGKIIALTPDKRFAQVKYRYSGKEFVAPFPVDKLLEWVDGRKKREANTDA